MCNWHAHVRILRIGICYRSEQEHSAPGAATAGHEDHKKNVLGCDRKLRYSAALQSARCNPDHCQPDDYLRASSGEITKDSAILAVTTCCRTRQRGRRFIFLRAKSSFRAAAPTFSIGCFSALRSKCAHLAPPVFISRIKSRANLRRMSRSAERTCCCTDSSIIFGPTVNSAHLAVSEINLRISAIPAS